MNDIALYLCQKDIRIDNIDYNQGIFYYNRKYFDKIIDLVDKHDVKYLLIDYTFMCLVMSRIKHIHKNFLRKNKQ